MLEILEGFEETVITLVGTSPLRVYRNWKLKGVKRPTDPFQEFADGLYWLSPKPKSPTPEDVESAIFGFPSSGVKHAITQTKGKARGHSKVFVRGAVQICGEFMQIDGVPQMRDVHTKIGKREYMRFLAQFDEWRIPMRVRYSLDLGAHALLSYLKKAGTECGIGYMRPRFGTFSVAVA